MQFRALATIPVLAFCMAASAPAQNQQAAQIAFAKLVHDYGNVSYGGNGASTFEFTNTGNAPLIIAKATGSCGCTVPTWPKSPIAPGETGIIKVNYDTKRVGAINKSVTITSNAANMPSVLIRIKGRVGAPPAPAAPVPPGNR